MYEYDNSNPLGRFAGSSFAGGWTPPTGTDGASPTWKPIEATPMSQLQLPQYQGSASPSPTTSSNQWWKPLDMLNNTGSPPPGSLGYGAVGGNNWGGYFDRTVPTQQWQVPTQQQQVNPQLQQILQLFNGFGGVGSLFGSGSSPQYGNRMNPGNNPSPSTNIFGAMQQGQPAPFNPYRTTSPWDPSNRATPSFYPTDPNTISALTDIGSNYNANLGTSTGGFNGQSSPIYNRRLRRTNY